MIDPDGSGDLSVENNFDDQDSEEDDEERDSIAIQLERIKIQINYSQLCKYSQLIRTEYLISDVKNNFPKFLQEFQRQNKIEDENIIFFFNIIQAKNVKWHKKF